MLIVRFILTLRPDTEDPDEAKQDALDFIEMAKGSWYSPVRLISDIDVLHLPDEE